LQERAKKQAFSALRSVFKEFQFAMADKTKKVGRWYFGGLASAGAACCTHPLDLLKVHLQTAGKEKNKFDQVYS